MSDSGRSQKVIKYIEKYFPKAVKREKYGGILFSIDGKEEFCGVFEYKDHINVEFTHGNRLKDPQKKLLGKGKKRKHLKLNFTDDVDWELLKSFLKQATE